MEASAQDEYVSEFVLEHLEEVVKREEQRRNAEAAYFQSLTPQQQQLQQQQQQQQQQQPGPSPQHQAPAAQPQASQPPPLQLLSHHVAVQPSVSLKHQLQVRRPGVLHSNSEITTSRTILF